MTIHDNVERVQEAIAASCARRNRKTDDVKLIAISKRKPVADIVVAAEAGVQHFGENRVEEAKSKIPEARSVLSHAVTWHMVGHVQSRKARDIAPLFDVVHSVDSIKIAQRLSHEEDPLLCLLQVNVSGERTKGGLMAVEWQTHSAQHDRLWQDVQTIAELPGLSICGLMTMAPIVADPETVRPVFAGLAQLRDALTESLGLVLPELSMGMTDDYPVAVEEGATMVRIGRAIFGERDV